MKEKIFTVRFEPEMYVKVKSIADQYDIKLGKLIRLTMERLIKSEYK